MSAISKQTTTATIAPLQNAKFITLEGTEGVGKTTAIAGLCALLDRQNIVYIRTREPGGTPFAEQMRALLLDKTATIDDSAELLALFAGRADHVARVIKPALAAGKWVICDRFIHSTVAYQGFGRFACAPEKLAQIDLLTRHFVDVLPDASFWLAMDAQDALIRAKKRSATDRFEQEDAAFFGRVYNGFAVQHARGELIKIDATKSPDQVTAAIWAVLVAKLATVR